VVKIKRKRPIKKIGKEIPSVKTYRDLIVWQKAMTLVSQIYQVTKNFPAEERYGLFSQVRRSAVSIPSNIAEGYGRRSTADYLRFLQITLSSVYELQTQIEIALNLNYLSKEQFQKTYEASREIERMLSSLYRKIQNNN
jgi:four helix bundle protein